MTTTDRNRESPALFLLAGGTVFLCVAAYAPGMWGPFLFDDVFEIESNPALTCLWPPWVAMTSPGGFPARPLPYYTFALSRAIHGLHPLGWHLTSVLIHLVNGWLVTVCAFRVLTSWRGHGPLAAAFGRTDLVAWMIATLWLVHPLGSQAVAYSYQRIELLGALAILSALSCFLSAQTTGALTATVAIATLGMFCKETAVAIPPAVLLVDWLVITWQAEHPWRSLPNAIRRRPVFYATLFATIGIAAGGVWLQRGRYRELTAPNWSSLDYALTQPRVILHYLRLAVWPMDQCFDYGWRTATSAAGFVPGTVAVMAAVALAVRCVSRRPLVALAILLFLVLLAPSSSIVPVNDVCVEHRMYLPLAVVVTAIVVALVAWLTPSFTAPVSWIAGAVALAIVLASVTAARVSVYASALTLWTDTATKAPRNQRALLWVGIALDEAGRQDEAFDAFGRTISVDSDNPACARAHTFRSAILGRRGRVVDAVAEASRAVVLAPADGLGWVNLARGRYELNQLALAEAAGRRGVDLCGGGERLVATVNLARIVDAAGRSDEAWDLCATVLKADSGFEPARRLMTEIASRGARVRRGGLTD